MQVEFYLANGIMQEITRTFKIRDLPKITDINFWVILLKWTLPEGRDHIIPFRRAGSILLQKE